MVCNRCIKVVREELEKLGYEVLNVELGEATISTKKKDINGINGFLYVLTLPCAKIL